MQKSLKLVVNDTFYEHRIVDQNIIDILSN